MDEQAAAVLEDLGGRGRVIGRVAHVVPDHVPVAGARRPLQVVIVLAVALDVLDRVGQLDGIAAAREHGDAVAGLVEGVRGEMPEKAGAADDQDVHDAETALRKWLGAVEQIDQRRFIHVE